MAFNNELLNYEGAGFLLTRTFREGFKFVLLGQRIKKPEDLVKDPTLEVEYVFNRVCFMNVIYN